MNQVRKHVYEMRSVPVLYILSSVLLLLHPAQSFTAPVTTSSGLNQGHSVDPWMANLSSRDPGMEPQFENLLHHLNANNYTFGRMPVSENGEPLVVGINVYVNRLVDLNEESMVYTSDIYLRQIWHDPGFDFQHLLDDDEVILVPDEYLDLLWTPDTFIQNSRSEYMHTVTRPNRALFVYANGTMLYSNRLTIMVWCNVHLQDFPMDRQRCQLRLMTYRYRASQLRMEWFHTKEGLNRSENEGLEINRLPMAMFTLSHYGTEHCTTEFLTGTFSCVRAVFEFKREYGYYVTQIYVPSALIVFMSWVTFWLSPDSAPARVSLGITTLLTMASQVGSSAGASLPKVSYVKYIDIWVTGCVTFLVTAVTEYAVVYNLWGRPVEQYFRNQELQKLTKNNYSPSTKNRVSAMEFNPPDADSQKEVTFPPPRCTSITVDKICRVLFPSLFAVFNLIYWFHPSVTSRGPHWDNELDDGVL